MDAQIAKSEFSAVWEKTTLETVVMIFQENIPEEAKNLFTIFEWITVFKTASLKSKIKKDAWNNIEILAKELNFSQAKDIFKESKSVRVSNLMLDIMLSLASSPVEINYCINLLSGNDKRSSNLSDLLDRLSKAEGLFFDWTAAFLNSKIDDVQKKAFAKAQEADATFEEWKIFNNQFYRFSYRFYLLERFKEMKKRADTFIRQLEVYNAFHKEESLATEILKDMENTAEKARDLVWVYKGTKSESIRAKIITAKDTFDNWLFINQSYNENWLKILSLKRMKEMAKSHYNWSIIWCRDSSEQGRRQAVSKMIKTSSNVREAKLTCHRALGTSLEGKAREKLKQTVLAL